MNIDFTPQPGSFLWAVAQTHPNERVRCANNVGRAGDVARDVRQMLSEIEELRAENAKLTRIVAALL